MLRRVEFYVGVRWPLIAWGRRLWQNPRPMADWIRKGIEQEQDAAARQERADQLQLQRAAMIKAKGRTFLDALTDTVEADVREHTEQATPDQRFTFNRKPNGGFSLSRLKYPASEMVCTLDEPVGQIVATGSITMSAGAPNRVHTRRFDLRVDQNNNLYVEGYGSAADLSQVLLEPVLFPS